MCKIFVRQCLHRVIYFLKAHIYKLLKISEISSSSFPDAVIKTIKRHYVHIWTFSVGNSKGRKKWPRLVRRGSGSQARTLATLS